MPAKSYRDRFDQLREKYTITRRKANGVFLVGAASSRDKLDWGGIVIAAGRRSIVRNDTMVIDCGPGLLMNRDSERIPRRMWRG